MPISITVQDLHNALPDLHSTLRFPELECAVDIYRDPWGIPHIRAENERDLFFAQGFATAQDRLWHMDFDRRQALGRWAEIAGPSGLERDRLLRAAGMGRTARRDYQVSSPQARAMVDAYSAGVNAFLATTDSLPIEYKILGLRPEPWENWHCPAVYKMRNTLLGTFEPKLFRTRLLREIGPRRIAAFVKGYPRGHLLTVPPGAEFEGPPLEALEQLSRAAAEADWLGEVEFGSNAWSLSGALTRSGLPLLGGDSHRGLDVPGVYYQIHLSCPEFSVAGHSLPGVPGALHFCHNEHVAWGMTHGGADTQDLFVERFREGSSGREYAFEGEWLRAQVRTERIEVREGAAVAVEITTTHHGPVVAGEPRQGWGLSLSDPGLIAATPWLDAAYEAMRAGSIAELDRALGQWTDRVNNYAVADVHGHFGYLQAGKIPLRPPGNGWAAVPGWSGEHEWQGYIPHAELPRAIDPEAGYAITCNQRVAGADYPYYVGLYFTPGYRARRIQRHLLELKPGQATLDEMARIHAERLSEPARIFTTALLRIEAPDESCARALALLRRWDFRMDRDQVQPTLYAQTRAQLIRRLAAHLLGAAAPGALAGAPGAEAHLRLIALETLLALESGDTALLPPGRTWPQMLSAALVRALAQLRARLGEDMLQWRWGRLHHTRPQHPLARLFPELATRLNPPGLAVHGDGDTPLAGGYALHELFVATGLSVNRYLFDPADWSRSRWIVPLGASGHPGSPHYADQALQWARVEYIPQWWDWEQIAARAEVHQRLEPA